MVLGYGIDEVVNIISKGLLEIGYDVTILTTEARFPLDDSKVKIEKLPPLRLSFLNDYWQRHFLVDVRSTDLFLRAAKKHDILITCDPMHLIGAGAKIRFKKPVIMYFFGATPHNVLDSFERKLEFFRQILVWDSSSYFADYIMTNSKHTKSSLPKNLRRKAFVNYHGIEHLIGEKTAAERFRTKLGAKGKKLILSVGRFSTPYKGMTDVAKIFCELKRKRNDIALLLVGGGDLPEDLMRFKSLRDIHFLTNVPYHMLRLCFTSCDIYCTASRWEGFNIPLVAAQANQKPVVAFNVGAHAEVTVDGRTGFLVRDYKEFASQLETLLDNDSLRTEMGENAAKFSRKFSWQKSIKMLTVLIETIRENYGL